MTMNKKELILEWLAALRSGKYKQGEGHLNCDGLYCCLGVLCEISYERIGLVKTDGVIVHYDNKNSTLPKKLSEIIGLDYFGGLKNASCVSLNDDDGKSFTEIADILEEFFKERGDI